MNVNMAKMLRTVADAFLITNSNVYGHTTHAMIMQNVLVHTLLCWVHAVNYIEYNYYIIYVS